jgi:streptogramin lyase
VQDLKKQEGAGGRQLPLAEFNGYVKSGLDYLSSWVKIMHMHRKAMAQILFALILGMAPVIHVFGANINLQNAQSVSEFNLNADGRVYEINPDEQGNLWVSDIRADEIWFIQPDSGKYTVYQGIDSVSDARLGYEGEVWWTDFSQSIGLLKLSDLTVTLWEIPGAGQLVGTAFDNGFIWSVDVSQPNAYRFDPQAKQICTFPLLENSGGEYLLAQSGTVWIPDWNQDRMYQLDPESNQLSSWQLPKDGHPEGLVLDVQGVLWWADPELGEIDRLNPATDEMTAFVLPVGIQPEMVSIQEGLVWYSEDWDGTIGIVDPSKAQGEGSTLTKTTHSITPTCTASGSGMTSSVTAATNTLSWSPSSLTEIYNQDGWMIRQLPAGSSPWGIAAVGDQIFMADQGRQKLMRIGPAVSSVYLPVVIK